MQKISPSRIHALNSGETEAKNLMEALALDMGALWENVFKQYPVAKNLPQSFTQKMNLFGKELSNHLDLSGIQKLSKHTSDTVRGWACYALFHKNLSLEESLTSIKPFANDTNSGVREWAWLALRPIIAHDIDQSLDLLTPWARSDVPNLRRFASEATRPRGVWCMHIAALRESPQKGEALLSLMKQDPHKYVQNSVANWLNDASKDHPAWVINLCRSWSNAHPTCPHTQKIIKRAQRTLIKKGLL